VVGAQVIDLASFHANSSVVAGSRAS
jgi:hypothetical protein